MKIHIKIKLQYFKRCSLGFITDLSLNAQRITCTGYKGFVPWDGACRGTATYTEYKDYPYQDCSWWCLRTVFRADPTIKCAEITYDEASGSHVCTCYDEC
ncbi:hypothetical protein MKW98_013422 [Papaver atlanticum]|uniref:Uncharacterized protein n=1 Tax=Papaver atlanticum TaxID=357466 RepID=A0AAD4SUG3_9MAGN|nr:hypothetical protein MKW98_013422 [Papaver atlanticum]